jgi:hypothetical protein
LRGIADINACPEHVCSLPIADIGGPATTCARKVPVEVIA